MPCRLLMLALAVLWADSDPAAAQEPLLGFTTTPETIELRVATGGCTRKAHFTFRVERNPHNSSLTRVTAIRLRPDYCKGWFPDGTLLVFTREEIGLKEGERFLITNPVQSDVRQ